MPCDGTRGLSSQEYSMVLKYIYLSLKRFKKKKKKMRTIPCEVFNRIWGHHTIPALRVFGEIETLHSRTGTMHPLLSRSGNT
jgi:hypothetical protein